MKTCTLNPLRRDRTTRLPACLVGAVILTLSLAAQRSFALPDDGADCRSCHTTVQKGMYLTGNQSTTNLGSGLLKVYQVVQGQTVAIGLQLTNRYNNPYGLSLLNLNNPGQANSANHLSYTGDLTWANRMDGSLNYFTLGPSSGTFPLARTHNLVIKSNTPVDFYKVQFQMAGRVSSEWSQVEDIYLQVLPAALPPPAAPFMISPLWVAGQFSVSVATESGHTYYLEYKNALSDANWLGADQKTGNGATQVLVDTTANVPQRFYRVRTQ